ALLGSELSTIFANAPLAPNALANARIREAHARATGKKTPSTSTTADADADAQAGNNDKKRIPGPDDDCPICYERRISTTNSGKPLTCVWCRARWVLPTSSAAAAAASAGGTRGRDGYINLAGVSGIGP
ncbi:hypothetical protein H0H93_013873, partial [Arthromyces matolae]